MTLRQEVSKILGLYIEDYGWDEAFKAADVQGKIRLDPRIRAILLIILKRLDEDERQKTENKTIKST